MWLQSKLPVQAMSAEAFDHCVAEAELIVADRMGPKVMRLDNGNFIKLFRRKRWFSSALFAPYAVRFCNNAFKLKALGVPTITPVALSYCRQRQTHIVEYQPLPGELLRGQLKASQDGELFRLTAQFIAELHLKGVYFRSVHFENIVLHKGKLGLIDIADMKIHDGPLSKSLRQRNFQHFMRYPADAELINRFGIQAFETAYGEKLNNPETLYPPV